MPRLQFSQVAQQRRFQRFSRLARRPVVAAGGLGDDVVDDAQLEQIRGGDLQRLGGHRGFAGIAPEDGGTGLRAGHGVDAVLEHQQAVGHADAEGAAGAPLADHGGHNRHP